MTMPGMTSENEALAGWGSKPIAGWAKPKWVSLGGLT